MFIYVYKWGEISKDLKKKIRKSNENFIKNKSIFIITK